jgi:hypothetical protein
MDLATVLFVAGGLWVCVICLFMALCRAAKLGDEALMRAVARERPARRRYKRYHERSRHGVAGAQAVGASAARR